MAHESPGIALIRSKSPGPYLRIFGPINGPRFLQKFQYKRKQVELWFEILPLSFWHYDFETKTRPLVVVRFNFRIVQIYEYDHLQKCGVNGLHLNLMWKKKRTRADKNG